MLSGDIKMTEIFENQNENAPAKVERQKVDMFLMGNQKYFPSSKMIYLKEKLYNITEEQFNMLSMVEFKDPTTLLIISLFLGSWGIDRFMLKDTGMGILKLLTGGCCGILTIIDWFSVHGKAKEKNFNALMMLF
jgi:TM2 domain-containing membrane protein YozV